MPKRITVLLSDECYKNIAILAKKEIRSPSNFITVLIEKYVEENKDDLKK